MWKRIICLSFSFIVLFACSRVEEECEDQAIQDSLNDTINYTNRTPSNRIDKAYKLPSFSGKAELCTYEVDRARYDTNHSGETVLIFVQEPFLPDQQVKSDNWKEEETVPVLKMNRIDRFVTGIYDYSIFTSVFTPLKGYDPMYPLKITMSAQDWCGQSFVQLNNDDGFVLQSNSYFQSEGDTTLPVEYVCTEDNLFNIIRIDTSLVPVGEFKMLPSMSFIRTNHISLSPVNANGAISRIDKTIVYTCEMPSIRRSIRVFIDTEKDNQIIKWTETYPTVMDGQLRTSTYRLKGLSRLPYWELNAAKDTVFRDTLSLNE